MNFPALFGIWDNGVHSIERVQTFSISSSLPRFWPRGGRLPEDPGRSSDPAFEDIFMPAFEFGVGFVLFEGFVLSFSSFCSRRFSSFIFLSRSAGTNSSQLQANIYPLACETTTAGLIELRSTISKKEKKKKKKRRISTPAPMPMPTPLGKMHEKLLKKKPDTTGNYEGSGPRRVWAAGKREKKGESERKVNECGLTDVFFQPL